MPTTRAVGDWLNDDFFCRFGGTPTTAEKVHLAYRMPYKSNWILFVIQKMPEGGQVLPTSQI
jgi:hypothetical protein